MAELSQEQRRELEKPFVLAAAGVSSVLAAAPFFYAQIAAPTGAEHIGFQFATDDHMVYSAWMRQAMDGHLLFDNRFTTDAQPGLTVHLYFLILGWLAKIVGIPVAATMGRIVFSGLFVLLAARLIQRITPTVHATKLALSFVVLGGGLGFSVWHDFGVLLVKPAPDLLHRLMLGRLPIDVWQPEAFVFPSMLTNGLFMVSLSLIVITLLCVLDARDSWTPVVPGVLAFGALMNIHSYDVLLVTLVLVGFLVAAMVRKQLSAAWILRAVVIGLGAIPAALWFLYVIRNDPVFQSRAATETFSPNFRAVVFGLILLLALGVIGMLWSRGDGAERSRRLLGGGILALLWISLFVIAANHDSGYFMSPPVWTLAFAITLLGVALLSTEDPAWNLLLAWACVGIVAIYFPALFQRKLAMGMAIPWAIFSGLAVSWLLRNQERSARNLVTVLLILVLGASSFRWILRERELISINTSNTTVHPVYLTADMRRIVGWLNAAEGKQIVVAPPGLPNPVTDGETNQPIPDEFSTPIMPDLNTVVTGLTGVYTFAGHWSETPQYNQRRAVLESLFFRDLPSDQRRAILEHIGATHIIAPVQEAFPGAKLFDFRAFGEAVTEGSQFRLIRIRPEALD